MNINMKLRFTSVEVNRNVSVCDKFACRDSCRSPVGQCRDDLTQGFCAYISCGEHAGYSCPCVLSGDYISRRIKRNLSAPYLACGDTSDRRKHGFALEKLCFVCNIIFYAQRLDSRICEYLFRFAAVHEPYI